MIDFPFEKGSVEARKMVKWAESQVKVAHVNLERAVEIASIHKTQGRIAFLRQMIDDLSISDAQVAEAIVTEKTMTKEELESSPVIPV